MSHPLVLSALALASAPSIGSDFVVPAGQTVLFDTSTGLELVADNVIIQTGGTLRVVGMKAFRMRAINLVQIGGTLDVSGFDSPGVATLNTTNIPEPGASGVAGGGQGGTGSLYTDQSTPRGENGYGPFGAPCIGGAGGEAGYNATLPAELHRRGGGGGGGALAADQPVAVFTYAPQNLGLIATPGFDGSLGALGATTSGAPPRGGAPGGLAFSDSDPYNDFWGQKQDAVLGLITGELPAPVAGRGGGAGGDAAFTSGQTYPAVPFNPTGDEKGAGGGGGGGLAVISARRIQMLSSGVIRANGGDGGGGENTIFLNRVGAGSGAGSGGYVVMQASTIDLALASDKCIIALGGRGGPGVQNAHDILGAGGNGGPGVIQLHVFAGDTGHVLLPAGKTLFDMTSPLAHVLMPQASL